MAKEEVVEAEAHVHVERAISRSVMPSRRTKHSLTAHDSHYRARSVVRSAKGQFQEVRRDGRLGNAR